MQVFQAISHVLPAILSELLITRWLGTPFCLANRQIKVCLHCTLKSTNWPQVTACQRLTRTSSSMLLWAEFPLAAGASRPHHLVWFHTKKFGLRAPRVPHVVRQGKQGHLEDSLQKCTPGPKWKANVETPFVTKQVRPELSSYGSFLPRYLSWAELHEHHHNVIMLLHNMTHLLRLTARIKPWESQQPTLDIEYGHDHIHLGFRWESFSHVCHMGTKASMTPWSFTSLRQAKVRATPWTT